MFSLGISVPVPKCPDCCTSEILFQAWKGSWNLSQGRTWDDFTMVDGTPTCHCTLAVLSKTPRKSQSQVEKVPNRSARSQTQLQAAVTDSGRERSINVFIKKKCSLTNCLSWSSQPRIYFLLLSWCSNSSARHLSFFFCFPRLSWEQATFCL